MLNNNSMIIDTPSWFIPLDILMIVCTVATVILGLFFLIIIIYDRTCHTVAMMLIANSYFTGFLFGCDMLGMSLFTFENDFKQISSTNSLCIFRGYLGYIVTILQNYSYLLQSIYRYLIVVYPTRISWQSARFQFLLISLTWTLGLICPIPYIVNKEIEYNLDNQICQMPLRLSFLTIYNALCVYIIPISLITLIYFRLVRYVREMSKNVTTVNTLLRAQRELKMVRQLVILVLGVATIGFPYALFILWSFFTTPPKYHFRIAYLFVNVSSTFVMITLYQFTEPLKISIIKRIHRPMNTILPR